MKKHITSNNDQLVIIKTLKYFDYFNYSPTVEEIYKYLKRKTTKENLQRELSELIKNKATSTLSDVASSSSCVTRYTLGGHGIKKYQISNIKYQIFNKLKKRERISKQKIQKIGIYVKLLSLFPQIKLIGLSGTMAMLNADEGDDIDLFIITARNRLWTGRFIALLIAQAMGNRRKRVAYTQRPSQIGIRDKACLNLFFDEGNLEVPAFKKTEYVAHEILQMKPLINKDNIYERFLAVNKWVLEIFPNASKDFHGLIADYHGYPRKSVINPRESLSNLIEVILKKFQLHFIKKHRTTEIISDTQLWFHPEDFELKIHRLISNPLK